MRLLSFSYRKYSKLKTFCRHVSRQLSSDVNPAEAESDNDLGDPRLVAVSPAWPAAEAGLRAAAARGLRVLPDFISEQEEAALLAELEPYLKRMRYEFDHWDNAIQGYRETERGSWRAENEAVLGRVRARAFRGSRPLPHVHVLDLAAGGLIKPHVDAVRFCGDTIAGLCLLSNAVMRLQHCHKPDLTLDALLQRRALYIMSGAARYEFTHAVLGGADSAWRGAPVPRARRLALILRSRPAPAPAP